MFVHWVITFDSGSGLASNTTCTNAELLLVGLSENISMKSCLELKVFIP